jgi:hypothetical protein
MFDKGKHTYKSDLLLGERYDPLTGEVTRQPVTTVTSCAARVEPQEVEGHHLHGMSYECVDTTTYGPDDVVRVSRPAVVAPCPSCGKRP